MTVKQILEAKGRDVATLKPEATVGEAAAELGRLKIGALIILDGNGGVSGILSERDIVRCVGAKGANSLSQPLAEVMTRKVTTCSEETTIHEAMEMMTSGRFRHLPVCTDGRLVGIVSIGDIVKRRIEDAVGEAEAMREYIAASG